MCLGLKFCVLMVALTGSPGKTSVGEAEHEAAAGTGGLPPKLKYMSGERAAHGGVEDELVWLPGR